jgi:hypothetical protein
MSVSLVGVILTEKCLQRRQESLILCSLVQFMSKSQQSMVCYRHNNVWHIIHSINLKVELFPPFSLPLQLVLIYLFLWLSLLRGIPPLTIHC